MMATIMMTVVVVMATITVSVVVVMMATITMMSMKVGVRDQAVFQLQWSPRLKGSRLPGLAEGGGWYIEAKIPTVISGGKSYSAAVSTKDAIKSVKYVRLR